MSTQGRNTRRVFSMNNQTRNPPRARGGWRISKDPWERRTPALMRPPLHNTLPLTSRTGKSGLGWKFDPIGRPILSRPLGRRRATNWPAKLASFLIEHAWDRILLVFSEGGGASLKCATKFRTRCAFEPRTSLHTAYPII